MDRKRIVVMIAVALLLALPAAVFAAEPSAGPAGPGMMGGGMAMNWEASKEVTLRGTVVEPPAAVPERGQAMGSPMTVRTADGAVHTVALGPGAFVAELGLKPAAGNEIEVIGLPMQIRGQALVLAREVMWNGARYQLRNAQGVPLWRGGGSPEWQRYTELWSSGTKETVSGRVDAIEDFYPAGREAGAGVMLRLRARDGRQMVAQLGPKWFVEEQVPDLKVGQEVTVAGVRANWENQEVLLAGSLELAGKTVRLRDAEGMPQWTGGWRNWGGWGPGSRYGQMYNQSTVTTVTGRIVRVEQVSPMRGHGRGTLILVHPAQGADVPVHLGPDWYMQQIRLEPKVGDEVSVTGSMVNLQGQQVMLASNLDWHNQRIELRAANGEPMWMGRGVAQR